MKKKKLNFSSNFTLNFTLSLQVLGNKRDLPGALDETGLIERMGLNAVQVEFYIYRTATIRVERQRKYRKYGKYRK